MPSPDWLTIDDVHALVPHVARTTAWRRFARWRAQASRCSRSARSRAGGVALVARAVEVELHLGLRTMTDADTRAA